MMEEEKGRREGFVAGGYELHTYVSATKGQTCFRLQ